MVCNCMHSLQFISFHIISLTYRLISYILIIMLYFVFVIIINYSFDSLVEGQRSPFRAGQQDAAAASIARLLSAARSTSDISSGNGNETEVVDTKAVKAGP